MKKRIVKTFNVKDAQSGATVETKSGHSVRILCYDREGVDCPILALVSKNKIEICLPYTIDGLLGCSENTDYDLVIVEEVEWTKFKEGDYVVLNQNYTYKVNYIDTMYHTYHLACINNNSFIRPNIEEIDKSCHKWTIQDAKPGDVLIDAFDNPFIFKGIFYDSSPTAYCGIDTTDSVYISDGDYIWTSAPVKPATYKEKQQFFNRLEEEGYKWDARTFTLWKRCN